MHKTPEQIEKGNRIIFEWYHKDDDPKPCFHKGIDGHTNRKCTKGCGFIMADNPYWRGNPDYHSRNSPRRLLEVVEAKIDAMGLGDNYYESLCEIASEDFMATADQKFWAIVNILEEANK